MLLRNIPYKSFCWVIGTTSFRTAKLNLRIEQQLLLLSDFHEKYLEKHSEWNWDNNTQEEYYEFMKSKEFLSGDATRKDKDAREKTSGLVDIGLINLDRTITEAGYELIDITKSGDFKVDNFFNIDKDSYVYFKQLLKTAIKINESVVRPYYVLAKSLVELGFLTNNEFTYLLPLAISPDSTNKIISRIKELRNGTVSIEDIIFENLMLMDNYQLAQKTMLENKVSEDLICLIGMNRKSRSYDKPYYDLYNSINEVFLKKKDTGVYKLYLTAKNINQKPGTLWRSLLFNTSSEVSIKKNGIKAINSKSPFLNCKSESDIKYVFFRYLHVFKAMATLSDYFDLNRRYFNLTDTLIFEDQTVKFDMITKYFFEMCINSIYGNAFIESDSLIKSISMDEISKELKFNQKEIYAKISKDLGILIQTSQQASNIVKSERYKRFNKLINKKFSNPILLELLTCFEERNDSRIEELVTDEADIPTIFEYILAIVWYKISERRGDILDYMKLSLEANLLPKTHAAGGNADIIYEYDSCQEYPRHSLLIEATLADGSNQRRMEMEPVSRHLGEYRIKYNNPFDYSLFISTFLHRNVVADFRGRKHIQYYGVNDECIDGMKIISLDTKTIKDILNNGINYRYLYGVFEKYYQSELKLPEWLDSLVREATAATVTNYVQ